jgi:hypothetical protein
LSEQLSQRLRAGKEFWLAAPPIFKRSKQRATEPNLDSGASFCGIAVIHGLPHAVCFCMELAYERQAVRVNKWRAIFLPERDFCPKGQLNPPSQRLKNGMFVLWKSFL